MNMDLRLRAQLGGRIMPSMKSAGARQRSRSTSRSKKHTAWKKNRQFGDSYGRAAFVRIQKIYIPYTHLPAPQPGIELPQLIENKPHRDFFFPVTGAEVLERIRQLPKDHTEGLSHVWLRHQRRDQQRDCFGSYCTGPGYRAIVLNPWPRSLQWDLGEQLHDGWKKWALSHNAVVKRSRGRWYATFTMEQSRRFYLDDLILHEVGHHVDGRWRSAANRKQLEDFAEQYAVKWARWLNRDKPKTRKHTGMTREAWLHLVALVRVAYPDWKPQTGTPSPAPHPSLTVSFRLVDRRGRDQSNTIWIRPAAVGDLTIDGLKRRVERANFGWQHDSNSDR